MNRNIIKEIIKRRKMLNIDYVELAKMIDIEPAIMRKIERGEWEPPTEILSRISSTLGMSITNLRE